MTIYLIVDGHPNILSKPENTDEKEKRNSIYVSIVKEFLDEMASRQPDLEIEVYWGNTSCVRSKISSDQIMSSLEDAISYVLKYFWFVRKNKGNLHLGHLFDEIRPNMNRDDAVVLLTDASVFKVLQYFFEKQLSTLQTSTQADITSYPRGLMFSIVVDIGPTDSDQMAELNELSATCNSETLHPSTEKHLPESIEVIGFVRSANMVNIPVDGVQFITPYPHSQRKMSAENRPPENEDSLDFVCTDEQDSEDLLGILGPALIEAESVALVLINEGDYGCITSEKVGDNFCLILNKVSASVSARLIAIFSEIWKFSVEAQSEIQIFLTFQLPEDLPDFIPNFLTLESGPDEQAGPLHFTTLQGTAPSYNPVVQSWVTEHGFNMDFQKMFRLLRKLPDRPHLFYQEVNRFRKYALAIGMDHVLHEAAKIIREEIVQLNATAQTHGAYVATAFEKYQLENILEAS
ncbi:hypothetical protein NECAME_13581 [Necator americanus]|uniref:Integrator complex subunit 14 C-terminal domain-containing protein n=1 Tax=Necator americanus TaxID=51031 RepID=W2SWM5_NECAM|nr:hypothetical protein NECAME_13581 [Necator americanus]ETN73226.1 hypothetical protein NECAME_13581 [Necator americanus]